MEIKFFGSKKQTEQDLLQIMHNFGNPREIAEEYLDKFPDTGHGRVSYPPTWLILVLTVFIGPVGIVLAWLSPAWKLRDKILATLIPVLILLNLVLFALFSRYSYQQPEQIQENSYIIEIPESHGKLEKLP